MASKSKFTPRKQPTQARAAHTWNAILDGAAQVLVAYGYDKATTDRIAQRAGVSVGSVYEYFPNKDAIFAALQNRWNEQRWAVFEEARQLNHDDDLQTVLRKTIRARIKATQLNPELNSILLRDLPASVTADQARQLHDEFLASSLLVFARFRTDIREDNWPLMARLMMHATHAVIDNIGASEPDLLGSLELEDELVWMMLRYVERGSR